MKHMLISGHQGRTGDNHIEMLHLTWDGRVYLFKAGLELRDLSAFASRVLGLKARDTVPLA